MDAHDVDLNLLVALHAMDRHRSVTRAAESIGLSQPAMSAAVARLRVLFEDPLYVKIGAAMQPTPRASALAVGVRKLMETVQEEILRAPSFDAAVSDRTFTLVMPDIAEANILPHIVKALAEKAPDVRIKTLSMPAKSAGEALEDGTGDIAIGYFPDLQKAGFFQQRLFRSGYVCIAREGHATFGGVSVSLPQFLAASHAVVRPGGREHMLEKFLQERKLLRRVALEVSNFMSLLPIIADSNLVATVPRDLAELLASHSSIRIRETPFRSPMIDVHQFWHRRLQDDAAHAWLRREIHRLFAPAK